RATRWPRWGGPFAVGGPSVNRKMGPLEGTSKARVATPVRSQYSSDRSWMARPEGAPVPVTSGGMERGDSPPADKRRAGRRLPTEPIRRRTEGPRTHERGAVTPYDGSLELGHVRVAAEDDLGAVDEGDVDALEFHVVGFDSGDGGGRRPAKEPLDRVRGSSEEADRAGADHAQPAILLDPDVDRDRLQAAGDHDPALGPELPDMDRSRREVTSDREKARDPDVGSDAGGPRERRLAGADGASRVKVSSRRELSRDGDGGIRFQRTRAAQRIGPDRPANGDRPSEPSLSDVDFSRDLHQAVGDPGLGVHRIPSCDAPVLEVARTREAEGGYRRRRRGRWDRGRGRSG